MKVEESWRELKMGDFWQKCKPIALLFAKIASFEALFES